MDAPTLPSPLSAKILESALTELPDGTRRATETCLQCWKVHNMQILESPSPFTRISHSNSNFLFSTASRAGP
jgi:hypothetical protein